MPGFLNHVDVRALPDGDNWLLLREAKYATRSGRVIYVHAGFITDFASIPWFFRRMFQPATGKHRRAAVVHDFLYRTATEPFTRKGADQIFLEAMEIDGVDPWKRNTMYAGVRAGGWGSFVKRA